MSRAMIEITTSSSTRVKALGWMIEGRALPGWAWARKTSRDGLCHSFFLPANLASLYLADESKAIVGRVSHLLMCLTSRTNVTRILQELWHSEEETRIEAHLFVSLLPGATRTRDVDGSRCR